jgi:hypothetical protein
LHALLGKLMEGLTDEYRPGKPSMNPDRLAACSDNFFLESLHLAYDFRRIVPNTVF